jgi:hypothetical protein
MKWFSFAIPTLLLSMTDAHFRCSFINADSSVAQDTLIDVLLNPKHMLQSTAAQNAVINKTSFRLLCNRPAVRNFVFL